MRGSLKNAHLAAYSATTRASKVNGLSENAWHRSTSYFEEEGTRIAVGIEQSRLSLVQIAIEMHVAAMNINSVGFKKRKERVSRCRRFSQKKR